MNRLDKAKAAYFKNHPEMMGERITWPEAPVLERLNKRDKEWAAR